METQCSICKKIIDDTEAIYVNDLPPPNLYEVSTYCKDCYAYGNEQAYYGWLEDQENPFAIRECFVCGKKEACFIFMTRNVSNMHSLS
jgi:hypothetical protein